MDNVYDDVLNESGDIHFGYEKHTFIPVSEYSCADSSQLRHIFFTQVQGTIPYNRTLSKYDEVKDNWFLSMDAIRSFIAKTKTDTPYGADGELSDRYGNNLIPFLNYVDVQNYIKRLRKHLFQKLGSYETLHFYAVGEYGPVHFRPHYHLLLFTNSEEVSQVLRYCHDKSWTFGRSDFQRSAGGASSYVASYVNSTSIARILLAVHRTPKRIARFGFVDYNQDSVLSLVRTYYQYLKVNSILTDDDKIILHASRCLTRFCNCSSDVDIESYINKLYRLFLYVFKFFRNWHLPDFGSDISAYSGRIMFIIKTGIEYEKKADYENMRGVYSLRSQYPELSDCMFVLPENGQESDVLSDVSDETVQLLEQLRHRSSTFCRDMIKHKKLNDANNIFNRMV